MPIVTHKTTGVVSSGQSDLKVVSFRLGEAEYGVDVSEVMGIYRGLPVIPVPGLASHIYGEVTLQGQRIPVVSLRHFVGLDESTTPPINRWIMVLKHALGPIALAVDCVTEVIRLKPESVEPLSQTEGDPVLDYITAEARTGSHRLLLPDFSRLLDDAVQ
jgi:purine-binding chemotaxis protein CheW